MSSASLVASRAKRLQEPHHSVEKSSRSSSFSFAASAFASDRDAGLAWAFAKPARASAAEARSNRDMGRSFLAMGYLRRGQYVRRSGYGQASENIIVAGI